MTLTKLIVVLCLSGQSYPNDPEPSTDAAVNREIKVIAPLRLNAKIKDHIRKKLNMDDKKYKVNAISPFVSSELSSKQYIKDNKNVFNTVWEGIPITEAYANNLKKGLQISKGFSDNNIWNIIGYFDFIEVWEFFYDNDADNRFTSQDDWLLDVCTFPLYFLIPAFNYTDPNMAKMIELIKSSYTLEIGVPCNLLTNYCYLNRNYAFGPYGVKYSDSLTSATLKPDPITVKPTLTEKPLPTPASTESINNLAETPTDDHCNCKTQKHYDLVSLISVVIVAFCSLLFSITYCCQLALKARQENSKSIQLQTRSEVNQPLSLLGQTLRNRTE